MDYLAWEALKNFNRNEFACHCGNPACELVPMDYGFMQKLQDMRTDLNAPLTITSGYRCQNYEAKIGGSGKNHPTGKAVDLTATRSVMSKIVARAEAYGFTGIGVCLHGDNMFIHLDITHNTTTVWSY